MKAITKEIKQYVQEATEKVLEEEKEASYYRIKEVLEKEYKKRFFNDTVLQNLIKESLENIVYINL
jgi:hypothetical protein